MNLQSLELFSAVGRKINFLTKRQRVLAQNIANIDTPEYKARDLREPSYSRRLGRSAFDVNLTRTNQRHFTATRFASEQPIIETNDFYESTISGNTVNLEENLIKINQTSADYSLATNLFRKYHSFINIAIGSNNR